MHFFSMQRQAAPNTKKLTEDQTATMIRYTAVKPEERQRKIEDGLKKLQLGEADRQRNPYAKEFGISVLDKMATVMAIFFYMF